MDEIRNLNKKRICDRSKDHRVIEIRQGGCLTTITANPDGTLNISHQKIKAA